MNFAQLDSVLLQQSDGILRLFEFNRQMAGVVIHSEVFRQSRIVSMLCAKAIEQLNDLCAGLQQTHRLRFQAQVQFAPRLRADPGNMLNATPQVVSNALALFGGVDQQLEPTRQRADAPFDVRRHKLGQ